MWPFAKLGLSPELGSSMILPVVCGMPRAKELLLLGEWLKPSAALDLGLVNRVVAPHELLPTAMATAEKLAATHPAAVTLSKRLINRAMRQQLDATMAAEQETFSEVLAATGGPAGAAKYAKQKAAEMAAKL